MLTSRNDNARLPDEIMGWIHRHFTLLTLLVIPLVTFLLYNHALNADFFLDDTRSIRQQPLLMQSEVWPIINGFKLRFVGYLSFWANYQVSGEDASAFRLVNLLIHAITGVLVYFLSRQLITFSSHSEASSSVIGWIAGLIALTFVIHPIQTQAVTYIVQRLASLMALFYLAALFLWVNARTTSSVKHRAFLFLGFGVALLLAMFTKQNSFTFPFVLILTEILIIRKLSLAWWLRVSAGTLLLLVFAVLMFENSFQALDEFTRETTAFSRWEYLSRQWIILWIYISKFFWPFPQLLDYGLTLEHFSQSQIIIAAIGHCVMLALAFYCARKAPLVAFGVLFFYLTHSVESGLIPIRDLAFEHRNYLPFLGFLIACGGLALKLRVVSPTAFAWTKWLLLPLLIFLAQATWARNQMWLDQEALLKQDVAVNPANTRAVYSLALWYQRNVRYDESLALLRQIAKSNDGRLSLRQWTSYVATLINLQLHRQAKELLENLLGNDINRRSRAIFLRQYGTVLTAIGDDAAAVKAFERSAKVLPLDYDSALGYGYSLIQMGKYEAARDHIISMRHRFGASTRIAMLTKVLVIEYRNEFGDKSLNQ